MEYNNSYKTSELNNYINYFHCLYKKILVMKSINNEEYTQNKPKCEHYIKIIYPKIKILIKKKKLNCEDIDYIYNLGKIYNYNK